MAKKSTQRPQTRRSAAKTKSRMKKPAASKAARRPARGLTGKPKAGQQAGGVSGDRVLELMRWAHDATAAQLKAWPAEKLCAQTIGNPNHALWTAGHMATGYRWWTSIIGGKPHPLSEDFEKAFGYGSTPHGDASKYPSFDEVMRQHDAAFAALMDGVASLDASAMHESTAEKTGGFCKDRLDAILKCVWHEGWHQGQLSLLKKGLGIGAGS